MPPGESLPDSTEGITRVEDLPRPLVEPRSRNYRRRVQAIQRRVAALFEQRRLFVRHHLDAAERALLKRSIAPTTRVLPVNSDRLSRQGCEDGKSARFARRLVADLVSSP